jgi:hypothetical protein
MSDAGLLLIGGLIGFISAVFAPILVDILKQWFWGPKLNIVFIENDKAFLTDTKDRMAQNTVIDAHYVRVRLTNVGRQIAKQCRAYLANVEKCMESNDDFEPTIYCDNLQLPWSARGNIKEAYMPIDLPPGIKQFVDIVSTRREDEKYDIKITPKLYRYEDLFKTPGKYRYTIQVTGDNVKPVSIRVVFDWQGQWDSFKVYNG